MDYVIYEIFVKWCVKLYKWGIIFVSCEIFMKRVSIVVKSLVVIVFFIGICVCGLILEKKDGSKLFLVIVISIRGFSKRIKIYL